MPRSYFAAQRPNGRLEAARPVLVALLDYDEVTATEPCPLAGRALSPSAVARLTYRPVLVFGPMRVPNL